MPRVAPKTTHAPPANPAGIQHPGPALEVNTCAGAIRYVGRFLGGALRIYTVMKRVLITGASGRVGSYICSKARAGEFEVHGTWFSRHVPLEGVSFTRVDFTSEDEIARCLRSVMPDIVIHAGALAKEAEWERLEAVNVRATGLISGLCGELGAFLVFISTDLAFDGTKGFYHEEDPVNPVGPYPLSKVMAEEKVRESGIPGAIVRIPINYGWTSSRSTFLEWILNEVKEGRQATLFDDQYRSPLYLGTLAEALLEIAGRRMEGIWHIGGAERISRYDFGIKAASLLGFPAGSLVAVKKKDIVYQGSPCEDCSLDTGKATRELETSLPGVAGGLKALLEERDGPCENWFMRKGER